MSRKLPPPQAARQAERIRQARSAGLPILRSRAMQQPSGHARKPLQQTSMQARVAEELRQVIISGELLARSSLFEMALSAAGH
jgi:hypothetical protein